MLFKIDFRVLRSALERAFDSGVDCGYQELGESDLGKVIPDEKRVHKEKLLNGIIDYFAGLEKERAETSVLDREHDRGTNTITVCDHCLRASCWLGLFYCEKYLTAGTVEKTREELLKLDLENPEYWDYGNREDS